MGGDMTYTKTGLKWNQRSIFNSDRLGCHRPLHQTQLNDPLAPRHHVVLLVILHLVSVPSLPRYHMRPLKDGTEVRVPTTEVVAGDT